MLFILVLCRYSITHMLDIKFIRENKDLVQEAARKKHLSFDVEWLLTLDKARLELLTAVEQLRGEQNKFLTKLQRQPTRLYEQLL